MLLDTSGLFAYHALNDSNHADAITLFEAAPDKLTHSLILAELVALANARRLPRAPVLTFVRTLLAHPQVEVAWVDEELHNRAMQLLEDRADKSYSLADTVSFILMRDRGILEALSTDHHFEQEGFRRLLRP